MKHLMYLLTIILLAGSCEKIDPFVETNEGKNVLGFYLDGEKVSYETSGGFPSEYPYTHCVYTRKIGADSLEISALLDNYCFSEITIKIPVQDISTERDIADPDITLKYLYRKYPIAPDQFIDGGGRMEQSCTELVGGKISFRKWDESAGILSGNFNFVCDAPQYDGSVRRVSVTDGNFDVKFNTRDNE